jgi:hypothetical protein
MATLYLLHANEDDETASRIASALREFDHVVYRLEELKEDETFVGDDDDRVQAAIEQSDAVIVILSPELAENDLLAVDLDNAIESDKLVFVIPATDETEVSARSLLRRAASTYQDLTADEMARLIWLDPLQTRHTDGGLFGSLLEMFRPRGNERELVEQIDQKISEWLAQRTSRPRASAPITSADSSPAPAPPQAGEVTREISPELLRELADDAETGAAPPTGGSIAFTAYYPREVAPAAWTPLRAYVYQQDAGDRVEADAERELGQAIDNYRRTTDQARTPIEEGALITATPELPGFQFNPPTATVAFFEDWHRFDFKMRARTAPLEQAANGRIVFNVEGVIVADLPISVFVTNDPGRLTSAQIDAATTRAYQAIFCSYSHRDETIVERVERAYRALGLDYLRDVTTLRSGQQWNAELMRLIDRADIFQLFWSSHAAASPYVKQEYQHALTLAGARPHFIRPVYWEKPMPPVPPELSSIHFAFEPTLDDDLPRG